jgi:hypothetical protein
MTQNRPPRGKPGRPGDSKASFGDRPKPGGAPKLSLPGKPGPRPDRPTDRPPAREQNRGQARTPVVPAGAVWLYGTHAVASPKFRRVKKSTSFWVPALAAASSTRVSPC